MEYDSEDKSQNSEDDEDSEDMDHDEIILGNTTDVLMAISKAYGDAFLPLFQTIAPKMVKYLSDEHPKSDRVMMIGCLGEIMHSCPAVIDQYFENFF